MSVEHRQSWEREHGQLQLQGPCSTGSPPPPPAPSGWLTLLPRAELTQELRKGILHLWTALPPSLCRRWPWGSSLGCLKVMVCSQPLAPAQG